ncbi:TRAP transporter small permease [Rhodoferax sp.]|uniref:TRAP transporter small permease n=1 Tax=Rhodoferax sp. TaxID=50421 RepID=UPI0025EA2106|nr:TRAP transporter small permease [Rhodoferax sp.]MCM2296711.1 TRAP transporter small permease [Rhodoferax sp.]MDD3937178.1 TRAP transporter small permease [Rhodoferax sp.]
MHEPIPGADPGAASRAFGPVGQLLFRASKVSAIMGGLMFVAIVLMSIISIVGRKLFAAPVPGDVEMLQMTAAFASASFFAYCHLNGGDVKVDFFTAKASPATVHRLDAFGSLLVGLFGAVITWRAAVGAFAIKAAGETSMILGWPVWIAQVLMVPGFLLLALAGFYMVSFHWRMSHSGVQA